MFHRIDGQMYVIPTQRIQSDVIAEPCQSSVNQEQENSCLSPEPQQSTQLNEPSDSPRTSETHEEMPVDEIQCQFNLNTEQKENERPNAIPRKVQK